MTRFIFQYLMSNIIENVHNSIKNVLLEFEATAPPTEPQPLPNIFELFFTNKK